MTATDPTHSRRWLILAVVGVAQVIRGAITIIR
jgi:hypothetical protein